MHLGETTSTARWSGNTSGISMQQIIDRESNCHVLPCFLVKKVVKNGNDFDDTQ